MAIFQNFSVSNQVGNLKMIFFMCFLQKVPVFPSAKNASSELFLGCKETTIPRTSLLQVPCGQIGSAWEWYHWIGLKKVLNGYRFLIFNFSLQFLERHQSSEPLYTKMSLTSCLLGSRFVWAQTVIFSAEPYSKNARKSTIVLWITSREQNMWRIPTSRNPNQNSAALWRIFSKK